MCVWLYTHVCTQTHTETKRRYLIPQSWSTGICRMPSFLDGAGNGVPGCIGAATLNHCIISQPPFTSVFLVTLRSQRQHKWTERRSLNKVWPSFEVLDPEIVFNCSKEWATARRREKQLVWDHCSTPQQTTKLVRVWDFVISTLYWLTHPIFPTAHFHLCAQALRCRRFIVEPLKHLTKERCSLQVPTCRGRGAAQTQWMGGGGGTQGSPQYDPRGHWSSEAFLLLQLKLLEWRTTFCSGLFILPWVCALESLLLLLLFMCVMDAFV